MALFEFRDVTFRYSTGPTILDSLNLKIDQGEIVSIIGPNGTGKSTLINLLNGWLRPSSGSVHFDGKKVTSWDRRDFARRVSVVPQYSDIVFSYTVREVVLMGRFAFRSPMNLRPTKEDETIANEVLERVGISDLADRVLVNLSGGERQLVLLARALVSQPDVVLLDEPTASLDPRYQRLAMKCVTEWFRETGGCCVMVSHDLNLAAQTSTRMIALSDGKILRDGDVSEVFTTEILSSLFNVPIEEARHSDGTSFMGMRQ